MNHTLVRLAVLKKFIQAVQETRQTLLDEMIDRATDPIILQRRFRMLRDLNQLESVSIGTIEKFQTENIHDYQIQDLVAEIEIITHRSA
jgi:hypothetical protein